MGICQFVCLFDMFLHARSAWPHDKTSGFPVSPSPYSEGSLGKELNKHVETTMNMSKNVRKFAGPHPIVISAACHPGPLSYHVSGSDHAEIIKEVIMTYSDMDSVASDWRPSLYFKDKTEGGKRSLPSSSEEINGVSTKQVQTV